MQCGQGLFVSQLIFLVSNSYEFLFSIPNSYKGKKYPGTRKQTLEIDKMTQDIIYAYISHIPYLQVLNSNLVLKIFIQCLAFFLCQTINFLHFIQHYYKFIVNLDVVLKSVVEIPESFFKIRMPSYIFGTASSGYLFSLFQVEKEP